MKKRLLAALAATLALGACNTDPAPSGNSKKSGIINNTCGPADGAAFSLYLSDEAVTACEPLPSSSVHVFVGGVHMDQVALGGAGYDSFGVSACHGDSCDGRPTQSAHVRFTDSTGGVLKGKYLLKDGNAALDSGSFEIRKCRLQAIPWCG